MLRLGMPFVLVSLVGIIGCSSSSSTGAGGEAKSSSLVGTWEGSIPELKGIKLVFTFTADGKFTRETVIEGMPQQDKVTIDGGKEEGTYKQADKSITFTSQGKDKTMTIKELADSKMVLSNAEGKEMTFKKK